MAHDEYWTTPRGDYASRRQAFLEYAAAAEGAAGGVASFRSYAAWSSAVGRSMRRASATR